MHSVEWLTTAPNPKWSHKTHGADDGQRGWRLHAVAVRRGETFTDVGKRQALCGVRPGTGWGLDLFIERKCSRCERRMAKGDTHDMPPQHWQTSRYELTTQLARAHFAICTRCSHRTDDKSKVGTRCMQSAGKIANALERCSGLYAAARVKGW